MTDPIRSDLKNLDLDQMRMKTLSRLDWIVIRSGQTYQIGKFEETKLVLCIYKPFMIQILIRYSDQIRLNYKFGLSLDYLFLNLINLKFN